MRAQILLGFTRALRAAGVEVTGDRTRSYLDAVALVGIDDRRRTYTAGRATLCGSAADLERYDAVFAAWFDADPGPSTHPQPSIVDRKRGPATTASLRETADGSPVDDDPLRVAASDVEILRHRDVAGMTGDEQAAVHTLIDRLPVRPALRRSARLQPATRGRVDSARTLRASLRQGGEPARIAWRNRSTKPRRLVLLVDVSGSMTPYAEILLRLAHRLTRATRSVETFTIGTRLTRVTDAMRERDPDRAVAAAGETVPDWAGGTRLGENLAAFQRYRRSLARGAVVVVFSDGWERGDPALLGDQVATLRRFAHRVVWANPHRGKAGYEPVQSGIRAVLEHLDDFVAGHSVASYARLMEVIGGA